MKEKRLTPEQLKELLASIPDGEVHIVPFEEEDKEEEDDEVSP